MLEDSLKNINAFIHLIKNQQSLLLNQNRHEDLKEASANFRETEDELADDIIAWCSKYTDIQQVLRQTRKELSSTKTQSTENRFPGTTKPIAPPPPPPPKVSRETLLNAIQESFPNQSK
ncbi:hypothetical protein [Microcoleus sp.]|uniref:hypothetical protein n=1 Tax=Microcoleus sp. TaxID=44472 RepID=UPI00403EC6EE